MRTDDHRIASSSYTTVSSAYFNVLDIPLLRGRAFSSEEERARSPVVVVSEGAAQRLWPGRDPIGQLLHVGGDSVAQRRQRLEPYRTARVIGVARNVVSGWIGVDAREPVVYYPMPIDAPQTHLLVHVSDDPGRARQRLAEQLMPLFGSVIREIHRMEDYRAVQVYPFRALHWVSSALGIIALLLTITGIYGVLSYVVAQRTKEIGVRMALGASAAGVIALVLHESVRLAIVGIVGGVALALVVSRLFSSRVEMMNAFDVVGYAGGVALVLAASVVGAYLPSRRAAGVDPLQALRHD